MGNGDVNIKKDLLYIYEALYTSIKKDNASIFDSKLIKKLKYAPEMIAHVLELKEDVPALKIGLPKVSNEPTSCIVDIDALRDFYYTDLKAIYNNSSSEEAKSKILDSISLSELKRLYAIISDVPVSSRAKKLDIVDMMRYYFSDEARTINLVKGM